MFVWLYQRCLISHTNVTLPHVICWKFFQFVYCSASRRFVLSSMLLKKKKNKPHTTTNNDKVLLSDWGLLSLVQSRAVSTHHLSQSMNHQTHNHKCLQRVGLKHCMVSNLYWRGTGASTGQLVWMLFRRKCTELQVTHKKSYKALNSIVLVQARELLGISATIPLRF